MPFDIPNILDAAYAPQSHMTTVDIDALVAGIATDGVLTGCAVTAQGTPNMTLAVASGTVRIATATVTVAAGNVTITAAHASNPRIDLVVVNSSGTKSVVAGTPVAYVTNTTTPVPPSIPASSIVLAQVYVPPTVTAITNAMVTDKRVVVTPGIQGPQGPPGTTDGSLVFVAANDGTTDVSNALSTALNNANTLNQTLIIPPGRYRLNSTISEKAFAIRMICMPGAVFETYHTSGHTIKCAGSISGTVTNLTVAVAKGDHILTMASTSGYAAGDLIFVTCPQEIWDFAQSSPDTDDWYHFRGQLVEIRHLGENIGGTVSNTATKITLMEPMHSSMAISGYGANSLANSPVDTLAIRKVTPIERPIIHARFKNMVKGTTTSGFVRVTYGRNIDIRLIGEAAEAPGTEIIHCFGGTLNNEHWYYNYDASAGRYAYGDSLIGATCHLKWITTAIDGYSCGSTNGFQFGFGEPYDIDVYPRCIGSSGSGFTTHQEAKKIRIHNPYLIGCRASAMEIRSTDTKIMGGELAWCVTGIHAYANASDLEINGVTIRNMAVPVWPTIATVHGYGVYAAGQQIALKNVRITNCTFEYIERACIRIQPDAAIAAENVEVAFNSFRNYNLLNVTTVGHINAVHFAADVLRSSVHHNRVTDDQAVVTSKDVVRVPSTQTAAQMKVAYNDVQSGITLVNNPANVTATGNY